MANSRSYHNRVQICMDSRSVNESFARMAAAAFVAPIDPTYGELSDIKTAVSEAVTNAIIHGYKHENGQVELIFTLEERKLTIQITDRGAGILDIDAARTPLFTTKPELERSGMGFTVMESFMDEVTVTSKPNEGTTVVMVKQFSV